MKSASENFNLPGNTAVFICQRVFDGSPILEVSHDAEGEWQFLCGGDDHGDGEACTAKVVCLAEVLKGDGSLLELAHLCTNGSATRQSAKGKWKLQDHHEEGIRNHIKEFGWSVMTIPEDEEGPGFSYSVGMFQSFKKPEVIVFGVSGELMHALINECGERFKSGKKIPLGVHVEGFLQEAPVVFKAVDEKAYKEHFGYARWLYSGSGFPAIQCFWPDKARKFPWEAGFPKDWLKRQPDLEKWATPRA